MHVRTGGKHQPLSSALKTKAANQCQKEPEKKEAVRTVDEARKYGASAPDAQEDPCGQPHPPRPALGTVIRIHLHTPFTPCIHARTSKRT